MEQQFRKAQLSMRRTRKRRGAVLVEMSVTIGLAFFFFFTALEFCRVSMIRHAVEHALYEGARIGITPGATESEVRSRATAVLRTIGLTTATIDVTPGTLTSTTKDVTVRIQLPLDRNLYAPAFFFRGRSVDRSITMQREGVN